MGMQMRCNTTALVIPGRSEGPDPESRGFGFAATRRPGM